MLWLPPGPTRLPGYPTLGNKMGETENEVIYEPRPGIIEKAFPNDDTLIQATWFVKENEKNPFRVAKGISYFYVL